MSNEANLKPVKTKEEARERGRAGGIASARARKQRKSMRETAEILLKMPMKNGKIDDIGGIESLEAIGKDGKLAVNLTLQDMTLIAMLRKAMKGDTKAMDMILELTGEKETPTTTSPLEGLAAVIKKYEDEDA